MTVSPAAWSFCARSMRASNPSTPTESEEKIALDRSDIVIAIKESEAEFYASLTDREVISVPFWLDQNMRRTRPTEGSDGRALRVGFIGALNVVNVANMRDFLQAFESSPEIEASPIVLDVAGDVCHHLESKHPQVNLLGRVESLEDFYDSLDVVVVPMTLSTGLKIKTGEALAFGKAVVAISDGFDGFPPWTNFTGSISLRLSAARWPFSPATGSD